jgi:hypothetical protein
MILPTSERTYSKSRKPLKLKATNRQEEGPANFGHWQVGS